MNEILIKGRVKEGTRTASGLNPSPPIKLGMRLNNTIALQKPFFKKAGVEGISEMHNGTINIDISPYKFEILKPDYEITCEWFPGLTETFWLVGVSINYASREYWGYIYYPCPSGVKSHDDDTIEFLGEMISGVDYGKEITVLLPKRKVKLV